MWSADVLCCSGGRVGLLFGLALLTGGLAGWEEVVSGSVLRVNGGVRLERGGVPGATGSVVCRLSGGVLVLLPICGRGRARGEY